MHHLERSMYMPHLLMVRKDQTLVMQYVRGADKRRLGPKRPC